MITNLSLIALATFATATAPLPQEPGSPESADAGWQVFDGVALIVNDEIVTLRQLNTSMNDARGNAAATTQEDADALRDDVISDSIMVHLQTQAGRSLGVAGADVERTIDGFLNNKRRGMSASDTTDWFLEEGVQDLGQMRQTIREELYRSLWMQKVSGQTSGADRPSEDRYVRPGQLREAYYVNRGAYETPSRYILQYLRLVANAWGDAETALEVATDLRQQIVDGADMGAFVDEYGAFLRERRGITEQVAIDQIAEPGVRAFLEDAHRGALSMVMPYFEEDKIAGYDIVRVVEMLEGQEAPDFNSPGVQITLQRGLQNRWDDIRIANGADQLWRAAYIRLPNGILIDPPWARRAAGRR